MLRERTDAVDSLGKNWNALVAAFISQPLAVLRERTDAVDSLGKNWNALVAAF